MQRARGRSGARGGGGSPGVLLSQGHTEERRACWCMSGLCVFNRENGPHGQEQGVMALFWGGGIMGLGGVVGNCNCGPTNHPKLLGCVIGVWLLPRRQQRDDHDGAAAALPCAPRARRCVTAVPSCRSTFPLKSFFPSLFSCLLLFYSLAASLTSAASTSTLRSERRGDRRKRLRRCSLPPVFQRERAPISPEVAPVLISDGGMERCIMGRLALVILASSGADVGIVLRGEQPLFRLSSQEVTWKRYRSCLFKHISPICIPRPGEITCVSGCHSVFWSSGIPK